MGTLKVATASCKFGTQVNYYSLQAKIIYYSYLQKLFKLNKNKGYALLQKLSASLTPIATNLNLQKSTSKTLSAKIISAKSFNGVNQVSTKKITLMAFQGSK